MSERIRAWGLVDAGAEPVFAFSTCYWQVNSDGLKLNGAVLGITPYAIIGSGSRFLAGPATDFESIACPLSLSTTIFSSQEYTADCSATCNVAYAVGGVDNQITEKDLVISFSGGTPSSD